MNETSLKNAILHGWNFDKEDYIRAHRNEQLLTAQIETSNICNLNCIYCFREDQTDTRKTIKNNELTLNERFDLIEQLADLGTKTINIIGAGEPSIDQSLLETVQYINKKNIIPVVFTNGFRLSANMAKKLFDMNASLMVKINSFDETKQDMLANKQGYTRERNKTLKLLIDIGFNNSQDDYETRLGIDSIICTANLDDIDEIYQYAKENNLMPMIKTFIPTGRSLYLKNLEIDSDKFFSIAQHIDLVEKNNKPTTMNHFIPYLGGIKCTQYGSTALYVTVNGDITACPGTLDDFNIGNIRQISINYAFQKIRELGCNINGTCKPRQVYYSNL